MLTGKNKLKKVDQQLVKSYLEGKGTEDERLKINEWFSDLLAEGELRKVSQDLLWDKIAEDQTIHDFDKDRIRDRIYYRIRLEEARAFNEKKVKIMFVRYLIRIAAVLFIPLSLFTFINWRGNVIEKKASVYAEIYSPLGARTSFLLPDGSSGWLNGSSYLHFPTEFTRKYRTVELNGEAYFNVKENPKKPFNILTDGIKVTAYGTSFNMMVYPDDLTVEVTLESGDIEIFVKNDYGKDQSVGKLKPGYRGVLLKGTNIYNTNKVDTDKYTSWKNGRLVFRHESMTEVVKRINRWYNVRLIIKHKTLESYSYRATFVDETLDEVLRLLQISAPIKYKDLGREIHPDGTFGKRTIELYYNPE